ncbi:MAG: hypothetical protein J5641_05335 [Bacteroidales bacterium]|nr:hypothetical protein [Bacteroidales bacterium]
MNHRRLITLLLLLAFALSAVGQTDVENAPKAKPKRKDHAHFALKYNYSTPNLKIKDNFVRDLHMGEIAGVASNSSLGFALYIPIGQYIFLQPEANFSLLTDWDAASYENGVVNEFVYGFRHRQGTLMTVPLYLGFKWAPSKLFRARAYLGPMFSLGWVEKEFQRRFNPYLLTVGAGLDLLNFLSVDMGYCLNMDKMSYTGRSSWVVSIGLLM